MSCERYRESLTDSALGGPSAPGLEAHLGACARCRAEHDEARRLLARIDAELQTGLGIEPPPGLAARAREHARETQGPPRMRHMGWLVPAGLAAAAAVLVVRTAERGSSEPSPSPAASRVAVAPRPAAEPAPAPPGPRALAPTARPRPPARRDRGPDSEVLVPPGRDALVRRLLAASRAGAISGAAVTKPRLDAIELGEVQITHITIEPLKPVERSES